MLKPRIKIILKVKPKPRLLDYLDNLLENERRKTGKYPSYLKLAPATIQKMNLEIKSHNISGCWADWPGNYRGISVVAIK